MLSQSYATEVFLLAHAGLIYFIIFFNFILGGWGGEVTFPLIIFFFQMTYENGVLHTDYMTIEDYEVLKFLIKTVNIHI